MSKIDGQMLKIYQNSTQSSGDNGAKISERETIQLIQRAEEINNTSSSCFTSGNSRQGNKYLIGLVRQDESAFSDQSRQIIQDYLQTGKVPSSGLPPVSGTMPSSGVTHGSGTTPSSVLTPGSGATPSSGLASSSGSSSGSSLASSSASTSGSDLRPGAGTMPSSGMTPGAGTMPSSGVSPGAGTMPSSGVSPGAGTMPSSGVTPGSGTTPTSPGHVDNNTGVVGPNGAEILNFVANKRTWACHWFPMQESKPGGDTVNNLYTEGGALDKFDMVSGKNSRSYEYANNRKSITAGSEFHWWGHCDKAATVSCLLPAPKHSVEMTGRNGAQVKFSRNDIQGLLVKVAPCLSTKVDFKGERFNSANRDNPSDPAPAVFLETVQAWAQDGMPFVLDIDRTQQVWNFPYDQVKIYESDKAPAGFNPSGLSGDGVKYYNIEMAGTGFDDKARKYQCYVQRDSSGKVLSSGWIKTPNTHNNPDFMWRPHPVGDLMDKASWQARGQMSNPEVDPQIVYDIYMKSLV